MYEFPEWSAYHRAKRQRRTGLVLTGLGLLAAVGGFALARVIPSPPPPPPLTTADLRQVDRPDALRHPYISFDCPQVIETGVVLSGRGYRNRAWTAYYYLLPVEDRFIVAGSDKPILAGKIQGR